MYYMLLRFLSLVLSLFSAIIYHFAIILLFLLKAPFLGLCHRNQETSSGRPTRCVRIANLISSPPTNVLLSVPWEQAPFTSHWSWQPQELYHHTLTGLQPGEDIHAHWHSISLSVGILYQTQSLLMKLFLATSHPPANGEVCRTSLWRTFVSMWFNIYSLQNSFSACPL